MKRGTEHDLIRLLNGELPAAEARALQERMRSEPELAEAYRRLERTWRGLEPPPAGPVPPGFTGRVMAQARSQSGSLSWSSAPGWVRATAAAALVAGAALGLGVGRSLPVPETEPAAVLIASEEEDDSLTGSYWSLVEDAMDSEEAMP